MNIQEIFDKGVKGVVAQGAYAFNEDEQQCQYLDKNGNRCMIGFLAKDNEQAEIWESSEMGAQEILIDLGFEELPNFVEVFEFMGLLQSEHDEIAKYDNFEYKESRFLNAMKSLASKKGLVFPI